MFALDMYTETPLGKTIMPQIFLAEAPGNHGLKRLVYILIGM